MNLLLFIIVLTSLIGFCIYLEVKKPQSRSSFGSRLTSYTTTPAEPASIETVVLSSGAQISIPKSSTSKGGCSKRSKVKLKCPADADKEYIPVILKMIESYFAIHGTGVKSKRLEQHIRHTLRTTLEWLCIRNGIFPYKQFNLSQLLSKVYIAEEAVLKPCYADLREWCDKFYSADLFKKHLQPQNFVDFKQFILEFLHGIKPTSKQLQEALEELYPLQKAVFISHLPEVNQLEIGPLEILDNAKNGGDQDHRTPVKPENLCPVCQKLIPAQNTTPVKCPRCNFYPEILELGYLLDDFGKVAGHFHYPLKDQRKHELVLGVSGSGKSNYIKIKTHALREHGIGVLTFQCAGRDSREHVNAEVINPNGTGETLIFTPSIEDLNPLRFNPLAIPEYQGRKARLQTHIENFAAIFTFAYDLPPPFPGLIREALQLIFEQKGWDITNNREPQTTNFKYPRPLELIPAVEEILIGRYSDKVRDDLKDVLRSRLIDINRYGIGKMFNCKISLSFEELLLKNVVFELDQLDDNTKRLFVGLFLTSFCEFLQIKGSQSALRHVIIIEEAHRVLSRSVSGQDGSVMTAKTNEVIINALAEFRKLGEGLIIITQDPNRLPDSIIKLPQTATILQLKDEISINTVTRYFIKFQRFMYRNFPLLHLKIGEAYVNTPSSSDLSRVQFFIFPHAQEGEVLDAQIKSHMHTTYYQTHPWVLDTRDTDQLQAEIFQNCYHREILSYTDLFLGIKQPGVDVSCAKVEFKYLITRGPPDQPLQRKHYHLEEQVKQFQEAKLESPAGQRFISQLQQHLAPLTPENIAQVDFSAVFRVILTFAIQSISPPARFGALIYFLRILVFKYLQFNTVSPVMLYRPLIQLLQQYLPSMDLNPSPQASSVTGTTH